jgi:hypothetical protein
MAPRLKDEGEESDAPVFDDEHVPEAPEAWMIEDLRDLGLSAEEE